MTKILWTVTGVPNQNVNWSCGGSSSQWFGTYVQSYFTHSKLNCFADLVCICFCLVYVIIAAMLSFFFFFFLKDTLVRSSAGHDRVSIIHVL